MSLRIAFASVVLGGLLASSVEGQEYDAEPILYAKSTPKNAVSRLDEQLASGARKLVRDERTGYLRSLLDALSIPVESQTLVFSKTSLQRARISPRTPRAIYFNDDVYVGFCQDSDLMEVAVADPALGGVFYAFDQSQEKPRLERQLENCLICHGSSNTRNVPGFVVRSVYADSSGLPILASGTHRIDHSSPLAQRWGGWYVTGTHGKQKHLGNLVIRGRTSRPEDVDNADGQNVVDLAGRFETKGYLSGHSDLAALMVLEHQADAHNFITRANFAVRQALHYENELNRSLKRPAGERWPSTRTRIESAGDELVEYLLFCEEAPLTEPLRGTSTFAQDFSARGPRDAQGRSLRMLDLEKRLFKYPCSYLVYSENFKALDAEMKAHVFRRLWEALTGKTPAGEAADAKFARKFAHLSEADRTAIREILRDTLDVPEYWKK